jgi:transcriptional regulator with XRE-family HTH domain
MAIPGSDPLFVAFGATVRALRTSRGLTQDALAERAQLHRTYVTDVELGRRNVSLYNIGRFAVALGVSMKELVGDTEARVASAEGAQGP